MPWDWSSDESSESESDQPRRVEAGSRLNRTGPPGDGPSDYANQYDGLVDDVLGSDSEDGDPFDYDRKKKNYDEDDEDEEPPYMLFDFRKGPTKWPEGVELVNQDRAAELLEKAKEAAAAEAKRQQEKELKEKDGKGGDPKGGGQKGKKGKTTGGAIGPELPKGGSSYDQWWLDDGGGVEEEEEKPKDTSAPEGAKFETLNDGSTALLVQPGFRLKLDLNNLLEGGDEKKAEREKAEKRRKKRRNKFMGGWGAYGKDDSEWKTMWKEWVNEYTITMDIKLSEDPPREGMSLFQTALIHAGENQKGGKGGRLKSSEGEALVSSAGGVGVLGTFGDVTKSRLKANRWHRVAVSVKCAPDAKQKGEMLTWIDAVSGAVLKSDSIGSNGRFSLDPSALFLFSSSQHSMMARTVAVRTVRVERKSTTDIEAKRGLAKDRVLSMFNLEREKEVDAQRQGLSLSSLFAKPRPIWSAPAMVGTFGDPFIEGTIFEGASCLAWSFQVLNLVFQRMLADQSSIFASAAAEPTRNALGDVAHIMARSAPIFKDMVRLLKNSKNSQLMSFLRKLRQQLAALPEGESLLLPALVEESEILLLLERTSERSFTLVVINTDPQRGLRFHSFSPAVKPSKLVFRTCMVLAGIPKKNALDDVFWMALYNLSMSSTEGDMAKFYDTLLPFLTDKPLEVSLVEAERADAEDADATKRGLSGSWRTPQRASTQYVRCIFQAVNFILMRRRGVSALRAKQVGLAIRLQFMEMILNDLKYMHPDENGQRSCAIAMRQISYRAVKIVEALSKAPEAPAGGSANEKTLDSATTDECVICLEALDDPASKTKLPCAHTYHTQCLDEMVSSGNKSNACPLCRDDLHGAGSVEQILDKVRTLVEQCRSELAIAWEEDLPLPSKLDLTLTSEWFAHPLAWDVEPSQGDPGQIVALQKFVPADMLQIPKKIRTRDDAVTALRMCDKLCTILDNQEHCVKNHKSLIASLIEHVFIQVLPVPKPRAGSKDEEEDRRAGRSERRRAKEAEKLKAAMAKREELRKAKGVGKKGKDGKPEKEEEEAKEAMIEELDMSPGEAAEERAYSEACIWDEDITYELQLELTMVIRRLMEHFAAAAFSIIPTRAFDAVRIVVSGCMCAITDALLRRRATNHPSEAAAQLTGRDATGRQLGLRGFGISVSTFASQTETMEVHTPEIVVARAAILDYFESPAQKKLDKVFTWDETFQLKPGRPLIKFLRMIGREIALQALNPHLLLVDSTPECSILMHNYPEVKCYRDIVFYWKYFLNPDVKAFPNALGDGDDWARNPFSNTAQTYGRMQAVLAWMWDDEEKAYRVDNTLFGTMHCLPDPNEVDRLTGRKRKTEELPKHRYPSTATPSFYVSSPAVKTEDDVIYRANLPSFDDDGSGKAGTGGVALGQRDSELLISFLTVPYLRIPLTVNFFASDDRVHKLASAKLRAILDSVLFEPGKHLPLSSTDVEPKVVPTQHQGLLGCSYGMLLNELYRSPQVVCNSVLSLLDAALALDTGSVCGIEDTSFNTSVMIILYVCRLASRVLNYIQFVVARVNHADECVDVPVREQPPDPTAMSILLSAQEAITERLCGQYTALLDDYLGRLHDQTEATPENENLINRNSRLACDLHAHKLLCLRTLGAPGAKPLDHAAATTLLGSFVYLTTRHTWNRSGKEGMKLMPETELYELLAMQRRRLVQFTQDLTQLPLDTMLQTSLHVATSTTGSLGPSADVVDVSNRWGKLAGYRSAGRFGIAGTRTAAAEASVEDQSRTAVVEEKPSEVQDTGLLGVEMDLQLGQMTLRSKHLAALDTDIANLADVRMVFGDTTMQASLLERAEHRKRYRLVGVRHEIAFWPDGHTSCPPLGEQWERDYDPAELFESERWLPPLFEPVRKAFFDGPQPPAMQFMLTKGPLPDDAEVAVLLGLHPTLGGPFKLVYLFRQYRCVHVYECVSHARQWWFCLHLSTNHKFALRYLQPSFEYRVNPIPDWWKQGAGAAYPKGVGDCLRADILSAPGFVPNSPSAAIIRDAAHALNLSGGRETFVPAHLLFGLIPHALLDTHRFWQDETPPGYTNRKRLRGYPQDPGAETLLLADIYGSDSVNLTGRPERVIRVESRKFSAAKKEFDMHAKVAAKIEALQLAMHPPKKKSAAEDKKKAADKGKPVKTFSVDDRIETLASDLITGLADDVWVPCKVLSFNSDGTYDVEYTNEWSWVGTTKGVAASAIREPQADVEGKNVWLFDGMSDSEDDAWRSDSDEEEQEEEEEEEKRVTLSFEQFQRLDVILKAVGWDVEECEKALDAVSGAGLGPYADMEVLAAAVKKQRGGGDEGAAAKSGKPTPANGPAADDERMLLLNLMYAPRRSKLFSLAKTLSNIESLSHICVWTKDVKMANKDGYTIDLVELPRLKLTFTSRPDHEGEHRLFSLDHADLFVSNDHNALTTKMLAGIPHSLLLSNLRGEMQLLVPVLPPQRPMIITQPYSTDLVIDRVNEEWINSLSQRFYLYPIHVSLSFAMTKGLNSALYLLLLRLLHREYDGAFRLCDSIATDSRLSPEGVQIFKAFAFAEDDYHPDSHAVRLKVSLVTIDSGTPPPWDLTIQLAEYVRKLPHVSATCRLPVQEELQLLESDSVVLDENSPKYKQEVHDVYSLALVKNRLHQLRASLSDSGGTMTKCLCFSPPREASTGWPWYQDNSVFGEQYNSAVDIKSDKEWEVAMEEDSLREELAPPGGWLTLACFHVLWSSGSVKLMPRIADLVPMHPWVKFLNAKADCRGMDVIAKQYEVEQFPTLVFLRGGKEIPDTRITGAERGIEKLLRVLGANVTDADRSAYAHLLHRQRVEAGDEDANEALVEDEGPVVWTWDVDMCGPQVRVSEMGLRASLKEELDAIEEPPTWEYQIDWEWKPFPQDLADEMERKYLKGHFFREDELRLDSVRYSRQMVAFWDTEGALKITENGLEGIEGYFFDDGEDFEIRRRGERVHVKGEDRFVSKQQKQNDARMAAWKEQQLAMQLHQRKERFGKTTEAIRGTVGFEAGTGKHQWTLKWEHEPIISGKGDAVGLGTSQSEVAGPCEPPLLGGAYDGGASVALYATGELYHKGKLLGTATRQKPRVLVEEDLFSIKKTKKQKQKEAEAAEEEEGEGEGEGEGGKDSPEKAVKAKGKAPKYASADNGDAALFGKGSSVTMMLDTDKDGGEVTFEVDGELLDVKVSGLFQLLGDQTVYPGLCLTPLDDPFEADRKKGKKKGKAGSEAGTEATAKTGDDEKEEEKGEKEDGEAEEEKEEGEIKEADDEADGQGEEEEEEEEDEEEEEEEVEEEEGDDEEDEVSAEIKMLSKNTKISIDDLQKMTENEREALAQRVKVALEFMNTARVLITAPVPAEIKLPGEADKSVNQAKEDGEEDGENAAAGEAEATATDEASQPIERVRWMWEGPNGWEVYSPEISRELETARRAGKAEHTLRIGESTYICMIKSDGGEPTQECNDETTRLRRHLMAEGLSGQWEMMSVKYSPPMSLYGEGAVKVLQSVWNGSESFMGRSAGLGFLFVYCLLQGQKRAKVVTGGFSDWWKQDYGLSVGGTGFGGGFGGLGSKQAGSSNSDSHRLGLLLAQLYSDRHTKSVWSSVINVMGRNKQLCVRMPEFKDSRKMKQTQIFNGWTDELEPRSAINDLFSKLVPLMQGLKKSRQGSFVFPPKPPHPELPSPPTQCAVPGGGTADAEGARWLRPELSDFGCQERALPAVSAPHVLALASAVEYQLFTSKVSGEAPLELDDEIHLDELIAAAPGRLFIVVVHATWCSPCRSFGPLFRRLAIDTPGPRFLRANVDHCDRLASRLAIRSLPTIKFIRGGSKKEHVLATIEVSVEDHFVERFLQTVGEVSTPEEVTLMAQRGAPSEDSAKKSEEIAGCISATAAEVEELMTRPLASVALFVKEESRLERGLDVLEPKLSFDVSQHDAARTAVAKSMLTRMKDDVAAFASAANHQPSASLSFLPEGTVRKFFDGDASAAQEFAAAKDKVAEMVEKLMAVRASDSMAVGSAIALITCSANYIDLGAGGYSQRKERSEFVLRRTAGQAAEAWPEFLFGAVLSTQGASDIQGLNPYVPRERAETILGLVLLTMLRANRVGLLNRSIGAAVTLTKLLRQAEQAPGSGATLFPKVLQAAEDLAGMLAGRRHFAETQGPHATFDPRFLMFEFVWNLLLRRKQIEIVRNFVSVVRAGGSKVKQMIMGAGKTTVVAPLMTLMLADGESLVLSVVPKALLEMSRTQMRETFANIMTKRVYTLKFERSTTVRPQMRLALQNAAQNRGVVVATPTTLKSIMLVYVETLRQLDEINQGGKVRASARENAELLGAQAAELAGIIKLFNNGVMLLDEVDLLLHPLKSELNFPLGEKFDLDCSENGERWTLPIHMLDAIYFASTGKASAFEARGLALDLLRRITTVLNEGFAIKALQRLPHITLLNLEWYHAHLKPLMAEWVYLWLQKQHLHGISRQEATTYMLEGAVARSESTAKLSAIESALDKVEADLGLRMPISPAPPTASHLEMLDPDQLKVFQETAAMLQKQTSSSIEEDQGKKHLLEAEMEELRRAREMGQKQQALFNSLFSIDEQLDSAAHESAKRVAQLQQKMVLLQKKIQEIETPRDDSFDNMTVLWASDVFAQTSMLQETMKHGEQSEMHAACGKLEEMGFTVRRCGTFEEAVERAAQLQATGHLRCVVVGGEAVATCGRNCRMSHEGKCVVCGKGWNAHNGHTCEDGRFGSFVIKGKASDVKNIDYFKLLMSLSEWKQSDVSPVPTARLALFAGLSSLKEDKRLALWKQGVTVTDDKDQLQEWVESIKAWPHMNAEDKGKDGEEEEEEEEGDGDDDDKDTAPPPMMRRESSFGLQTLKLLRQRLQNLESMKEAAHDAEDAVRAELRQQAVDKHEELEREIQRQLDYLSRGLALPAAKHLPADDVCGHVGPTAGRDAAVALAWLHEHASELTAEAGALDGASARHLRWCVAALRAEHKWLSQAALAAKVLAHVTAPLHKKLLNLCHDMLRTFLPHVFAKINRVSYGLLSSEDCEAALEEDPNVPRSRLKLAVPFIGKDVPSKSSEFAHPDVIIGLTILAYRYTGMRYEDFVDLVDAMTTEFNLEIGPARDRPSSKRHETWVLQAGGRIRGLKKEKSKKSDGGSSGIKGTASSERLAQTAAEDSKIEVVQLKFLQKSNKEQMEKLYELWRKEPMAIHYYLCKFIFPAHMRSQKLKISASGQSVGGDMLVGRRIGFSGTPSDLLPKELGKCDYETGDDGKMLSTVLDPTIASHELLSDDWTVQSVLQRIAKSTSPRYHALIDTGALITGYSNQEVAAYLLEHGLEWCDGVVFLDENDEKQVLVRATGRAVWADQCGVPLERRFAFYDQIHTTGMDIKHVVNATAVITLGKDMVFRDYVQGAYRMRGIGAGQKIHLFIIPEVADLMRRELATCGQHVVVSNEEADREKMLVSVVAWLVINSMLSEQMQWSMLCLQNVSNIYRKNAFLRILQGIDEFKSGTANDVSSGDGINRLPLRRSLAVFDEDIDFSLEATVPDPIPFEKKLRDLLEEHHDFIVTEQQHEVGHKLLVEVEELSIVGDSASRLDTEQEREQEQEQQKEIKTKREQQVEVEKFVEREYSRHQERPQSWPLSMLAVDPSGVNADQADQHPFYALKDFHLLNQEPLCFPNQLMVSRNYFNPEWSGLRRVKNVVIVMEWAPSTEKERLRLLSAEEHSANSKLDEVHETAVKKVHTLLSVHMGEDGRLTSEGLAEAVRAATDRKPSDEDVEALLQEFGQAGGVPADGLRKMLTSGRLRPEHKGRYWIAVSLAEAETLRRVLHVRMARAVLPGKKVDLALHLSQSGQEMGRILDTSAGWRESKTGASPHETAVTHGCFRFFDGDMHYLPPTLTKLVRVLQKAHAHDRELFFQTTVNARRRIERKWQETPLSTLFTVSDEWMALKQRAQAAFVRHAVKAKGLSPWEAFIAFDADNNSRLAPSELYGALKWLQVPELTAEDVVDFFELADHNRDGMIEYAEYMTLMEVPGEKSGQHAGGEEEEEEDEDGEGAARKEPPPKIEPYGADELREILVRRRRNELERQKEEQARRTAQQQELDLKTYRQELLASAEREGGSNPKILLPGRDAEALKQYGSSHNFRLVEFSFGSNQHPLRTFVSGKCKYVPVLIDDVRKHLEPMRCTDKHPLVAGDFWSQCYQCKDYGSMVRGCTVNWSCNAFCCSRCYRAHEEEQVKERSDPAGKKTALVCDAGCELTLQLPPLMGPEEAGQAADKDKVAEVQFAVTAELRLHSLPPRGQQAALLRFTPKDISNSRRLHRASVYLGESGVIGSAGKAAVAAPKGKPKGAKDAEKDKDAAGEDADGAGAGSEKAASVIQVKAGRWFVLTIAVDSVQGKMTTYVDGKLSHEESGVDVRDLRLAGKIILLGGGKAAQTRGGTVRRLLLHGGLLDEKDVQATYASCVKENAATGGKLTRIQAVWRGRQARKVLEAEGITEQLRLSRERREKQNEEEEEE